MSKQKKQIMGGSSQEEEKIGDTKYTKVFIGGLAWATQRESIKRYFERFGLIVEAVVIFDKRTGRSKGYGFVTFKHPDSAMKACENPYPVIDGRRTNCNLAAFGAQKNPHTNPQNNGSEILRSSLSSSQSNSLAVSTYLCENVPEFYTFPYSAYRYPCSSQDILVMNYENGFGWSANNEVYVGYYVPLYSLQGQSFSGTKITENTSQLHHIYGTRMLATSDPGFASSRQNSSA